MGRRIALSVVALSVLLLAGCGPWTHVGYGPARTGFSAGETAITTATAAQLAWTWSVDFGGRTAGEPVVADGAVFVTASARPLTTLLAAHDAETGARRWSAEFPSDPRGGTSLGGPAVAGTTAYVGRFDGMGSSGSFGAMRGYDAATGAVRSDTGSFSYVAPTGAAAVAEGRVFSSYAYCPPLSGTCERALAAFVGNEVQFLARGGDTSPAVADGLVYSSGGATLYATPADGQGVACRPIPAQPSTAVCEAAWSASTGGPAITTRPAVAGGTVYVGAADGRLHAFPAGGCGAPTCAALWSGVASAMVSSAPAVARGTVFVGSEDGRLLAFPAGGCGAPTCAPSWSGFAGGEPLRSSPSIAGEVLYVGSDDGRLRTFRADGCGAAACNPLGSVPIGAPVRTSPAVVAGTVYVTSGTNLVALAVPRS